MKLSATNECISVWPVSTAELMCRYDTAYIAWWRGSRASLEATGCCHRASTHVISPWRTTWSHAKKMTKKAPYLLAVSLAAVMRWYGTMRSPMEGSGATTEDTGRRHRASIAAKNSVWTCIHRFFPFSLSTRWKGGSGDVKAPINNRGMAYQSNGKELRKTIRHLVGVVNIADNV